MKKRIWAVALLLVLAFTISAEAAGRRAIERVEPVLRFNGTTAQCSVTCQGESAKDNIRATLTLYQGSTFVDSWSKSGTYKVQCSGSCGAESGKSYTLTLSWSVNGVTQPSASVTRTCP